MPSPAERKAYLRAYHAAHREERRVKEAAYRAAHREKINAYARSWYATHVEKYKTYAGRDKESMADRVRRRLYGLSIGAYDAMLEEQGGCCAICRRPPGKHGLNVDHDHVTGAVRRLLCSNCNTGLGLFQEDPNLLRAALRYLEDALV